MQPTSNGPVCSGVLFAFTLTTQTAVAPERTPPYRAPPPGVGLNGPRSAWNWAHNLVTLLLGIV
jgi:hypothetical protein